MIKILKGATLSNAVKAFASTVSTFTGKVHQLAASAVIHNDDHGDAKHVQAVYDALPTNYKRSYRLYVMHCGKLSFDSSKKTFSFNKKAKSDHETLMNVSPSEYAKTVKPVDPNKTITAEQALKSAEQRAKSLVEYDGMTLEGLKAAMTIIQKAIAAKKPIPAPVPHIVSKTSEAVKKTRAVKTMAELKSVIAA